MLDSDCDKLRQTRFAKVQAIYQFLLLGDKNCVLSQFCSRDDDLGDEKLFMHDLEKLFESIEVFEKHLKDDLIGGKWKWEHINYIVKAILLCGLSDMQDYCDKKQIISHYISIARIFGEEESISLIHSKLLQLSKI